VAWGRTKYNGSHLTLLICHTDVVLWHDPDGNAQLCFWREALPSDRKLNWLHCCLPRPQPAVACRRISTSKKHTCLVMCWKGSCGSCTRLQQPIATQNSAPTRLGEHTTAQDEDAIQVAIASNSS